MSHLKIKVTTRVFSLSFLMVLAMVLPMQAARKQKTSPSIIESIKHSKYANSDQFIMHLASSVEVRAEQNNDSSTCNLIFAGMTYDDLVNAGVLKKIMSSRLVTQAVALASGNNQTTLQLSFGETGVVVHAAWFEAPHQIVIDFISTRNLTKTVEAKSGNVISHAARTQENIGCFATYRALSVV